MISHKIQEAINEQLNREMFSEYLYLSMQAWFASESLDGFANWMAVQAQEEHFHAMKFYQYIIDRGGKVVLKAIAEPEHEFKSAQTAFEMTLKHEQYITKSINELVDLAIKENDHALRSFLQWYVDEQVEEEANADKLLKQLILIKKDAHAILMLDRELATRVYTPPVTTA